MRVLAVGNRYPPHGIGGYELVWRSAVLHLRASGHDVGVLTTDHRDPVAGGPSDDAGVHRELRWWWRDGDFPRYSLRERVAIERHNHAVLRRHLDSLRPDVVAWWAMGGMSMSLVEAVRRRGLPAVGLVLDDWLVYGPLVDSWMRLFERRAWLRRSAETAVRVPASVDLAGAARWLFISETTCSAALDARGALPDSGVLHCGIDPAWVDPQPPREWAWRLLYVGRTDPRKGVGTAIAALAELPEEATLRIVGEGDAEAERELAREAAAAGVEERVLFGPLPTRDELKAIYAGCDAVVFPVLWPEPWGLVPLEAMGLGRPVLATGQGGSGEYLRDGQNCLLHPPGDASALAAAVRRLAADAELRERLRAGGAVTAPRFTADRYNAGVEAALSSACERGGSRGAPSSRAGRSAS